MICADVTWGPQEHSVPRDTDTPVSLELVKSRSLSGFIAFDTVPVHWM